MKLVKLPQTPDSLDEPDWTTHLTDPVEQATASQRWNIVIAEMSEAHTLSASNAASIRRYVLILALYDRAFAAIEAEGTVIKAKRTALAQYNPKWSILKDCDALATRHETELGLSPLRRGTATPAKKQKKSKTSAADSLLTP